MELTLNERRNRAAMYLMEMRGRTRWGSPYWLFSAGRWSEMATKVIEDDSRSAKQVEWIVATQGNRLPIIL